MINKIYGYFGIFNLVNIPTEVYRFGKDILWWLSTRSKTEKIIGVIGIFIIVIKIFSINSSPQFVLPVIANLFIQLVIFSYLLYISSMYWFVRTYRHRQTYLLGKREILHDFVTNLKENEFFKVTDTKLIADGKTNSNELNIIAAIVIPSKAQVGTMRRHIVYIILFSIALLFLNSYGIFIIASILAVTWIYMSLYDRNAVSLIMESFRQTAQALYNYHAYDAKKCKNFICNAKDEEVFMLKNLYDEILKNT